MSYRPLIIKSEFTDYVKLGANVTKNSDIDTYIKDMQEIEFKPTVPLAFYNEICGSPGTELTEFLNEYVKKYLICGAYEKFLLWHGRNVAQFGLRENQEDTSTPISDKARAELIADVKRKSNVYLLSMNDRLNDVSYTFDGVVYDFNSCDIAKSKPKIGMKQVGGNRGKYWDKKLERWL